MFAKKCAICGTKMTVFENIWVEKVKGEVCLSCYQKLTNEVENKGANAPEPEEIALFEQIEDKNKKSQEAPVEERLKVMEKKFNRLILMIGVAVVVIGLVVFMVLANR